MPPKDEDKIIKLMSDIEDATLITSSINKSLNVFSDVTAVHNLNHIKSLNSEKRSRNITFSIKGSRYKHIIKKFQILIAKSDKYFDTELIQLADIKIKVIQNFSFNFYTYPVHIQDNNITFNLSDELMKSPNILNRIFIFNFNKIWFKQLFSLLKINNEEVYKEIFKFLKKLSLIPTIKKFKSIEKVPISVWRYFGIDKYEFFKILARIIEIAVLPSKQPTKLEVEATVFRERLFSILHRKMIIEYK